MFETFFGAAQNGLPFVVAFIVALALIAATAWLVRRAGSNRARTETSRGRQRRLAVIDTASVDGRRRLVLVRRDNTEHLMMIGGPADLVIEANIVRAAKPARDVHAAVSSAATDMLPRPMSHEGGNMWPLQPEPAPIQGVDALALKAPQRHAAAPPPALTAKEDTEWSPDPEPPRPHQTEPQRRGPPARDPLVSLAKELTRTAQPQPAPATPELRPARHKARIERSQAAESPLLPPPAPSADKTQFNSPEDQGLAEMTQRLDAALRRSPKAD